MARFVYKVVVDVPDDSIAVENEDIILGWSIDLDKDGKFSPPILADIVMSERLVYEEDYGFDYELDWHRVVS